MGTNVSPHLDRKKALQNQDDYAAATAVKVGYPTERPAEVQSQRGVGLRRTQFTLRAAIVMYYAYSSSALNGIRGRRSFAFTQLWNVALDRDLSSRNCVAVNPIAAQITSGDSQRT